MRAVVGGAGAWGTAFAHLLRERGHDVFVAGRAALDDAPYEDAELVVLAVPSHAFREVLTHVRGRAPVLSLTKGLDPATGERLSTLVRDRPVAVLSGPNMAEEVLAGLPGATVRLLGSKPRPSKAPTSTTAPGRLGGGYVKDG